MKHAGYAKEFLDTKDRAKWHDETLWMVREKRDKATEHIPEWEQLRELGSTIKEHTLSNLDNYLNEFEKNATANGVQVHWASTATEHNEIVAKILKSNNATSIVKSKSILTEECGLNHFLEEAGYEVVDTDLGERIIQFAKQAPSHIVMPAIHMKKKEISEIFHKFLNTDENSDDAQYLTEAARTHLKSKFHSAEVAITGVNFGIAETGGVVVCTNEGNADLGVHLADIHIASMGIEKLIPKAEHLGVFLRLLARSATGQSITSYSSHFHKPKKNGQMHIILVDNGRSDHLAMPDFRAALKCIRCGACMNTCPIYRRSGGYSYNTTVPGPIGSILSPRVNMTANSSLPFASTLCGSCTDVCPVKIDIHEQLYKWRQVIAERGELGLGKRLSMKIAGTVLSSPSLYNLFGKIARKVLRSGSRVLIYNPFNTWGKKRELPVPEKYSFKDWYKKNRIKNGG